jgi:hypothetical protein
MSERIEYEGNSELMIGLSAPFDALPAEMMVRAFGVDYGHVRTPDGGDFFVTRFGWPWLPQLLPGSWYVDQWYSSRGQRLRGSTGTVYRVRTRPVFGRTRDIVVKFSRLAQEVPLEIATTFPDNVSPELIANARFNSPMEEFGLLMELRRGKFGPPGLRIRTQVPLAIFAPPKEFELWQLGRSQNRFRPHHQLLAADQEGEVKAIELDIKRMYVLLYGWIEGLDAEEALEAGLLDENDLRRLTPLVVEELRAKGFRVLDNKPKHFILRRRRDGRLLERSDHRLVYALVDYELLQRTQEHQRQFKAAQRASYWQILRRQTEASDGEMPSHLRRMTIFGVDYVFGSTPDGGKLWVAGRNPDLFDYYVPDRWRRTSRVKLSLANEVYRTRTRDNIHLVYRRSRVGARPRVDPLYPQGRRILEHGYNSPFEEVAIAEHLRQAGIRTTHPRAVFRTGHPSTRTFYLRDERRFEDHADLLTPEWNAQPILQPDYDYYTLWGRFRGIDPVLAGDPESPGGVVDLEQARDEGLVSQETFENAVESTRKRLAAIRFPDQYLDAADFVVRYDGRAIRRDDHDRLDIILCIDALLASEFELIDLDSYRHLIHRLEARLEAADCEKLNLAGNHVLLSMSPDGRFQRDAQGEIETVLSSFEFIRGLYRPIR